MSNPRVGESEEDEWQTPKSGSVGGEGGHGGRRHSESKQERSYYKKNPEKQEQGRNAHIQSASETVQQGKHLRRRADFRPFSGVATGFRAGSRACHALHTTAEHPATDQLLTSY